MTMLEQLIQSWNEQADELENFIRDLDPGEDFADELRTRWIREATTLRSCATDLKEALWKKI